MTSAREVQFVQRASDGWKHGHSVSAGEDGSQIVTDTTYDPQGKPTDILSVASNGSVEHVRISYDEQGQKRSESQIRYAQLGKVIVHQKEIEFDPPSGKPAKMKEMQFDPAGQLAKVLTTVFEVRTLTSTSD